MQIKLWGVRGSLPTPHAPTTIEDKIHSAIEAFVSKQKESVADLSPAEFVDSLPRDQVGGYGGNTACMQVKASDGEFLIVDGGSGIRRLGEELLGSPLGKGQGKVHLLFTHFHWDHMIGLPFFIPAFIPGNEIHCYSVSPGLENCVKKMFRKPNFPVPFEKLGAKFFFHELEPRQSKKFGKLSVTPYKLDHPDPCWGYKVQEGKKTFSYCVDTEGNRVSREDLGEDLPLYQDVDLMIFDAQYTFMEATEKINWGHASGPIGLDIAMREGVKKLYFIHHDPAASDLKIAQAEKQTRDYYDSRLALSGEEENLFEVDWCFAYEGLVVDL